MRSDQIQKCTGIPMPYLRKILFIMGKEGLIQTKRGRQGGFLLARPADEITLLEIARVMGKHNPLPDCLLELPGCSDKTPCPLHNFWEKERAKIEKKLGQITIAEAAGSVVSARWGKLTCCPPERELAELQHPKKAIRQKQPKGKKAAAKKKKAQSGRRKPA